ncbi:MAG TPA: AAA family ATPase, partial [Longimicrobiaceae bacterium]|nr:AAA family ATPase [Longimicrobiaceae bacterium]
QRLLAEVAGTPLQGTPPLSLSVSVGVATFPDDGTTAESLFERADGRMYEAKRAGRGQVVAADAASAAQALFQQDERLVERVHEVDRLNRFLDAMPLARRGVVRVAGAPGSGRTRMLAEARALGELRGLRVLCVRGRPELRAEPYGALRAALEDPDAIPPSVAGPVEAATLVRRALHVTRGPGLLICADDTAELDRPTAAALRALLAGPRRGAPVALAYAADDDGPDLSPPDIGLRERLDLRPLTPEGVRVWLRTLLRWEAPEGFLEWLRERTGGLPGSVRRTVVHLVDRHLLAAHGDEWTLAEGYRDALPPPPRAGSGLGEMRGFPRVGMPLLGRDPTVREVVRTLRDARLLTLCGPAGCGKTRLAIEAAHEAAELFADGAVFVSLRGVASAAEADAQLADALGDAPAGGGDLRVSLLRHLRRKRVLLVLDGVDGSAVGADLAAAVVDAAPEARVLATSRDRLHRPGEWMMEVEALRVPKWSDAERMGTSAAVQLFVERASSGGRTAAGDAEDAVVARICQLLQGHPLATEMAAAQLGPTRCRDLLHELETNLDGIDIYHPAAAPERRVFRAVLELAWRLMPAPLRSTVRRASLLPGAFGSDAALAVAGADRDALEELERRGLLARTGDDRFALHAPVREAAAAKLDDFPRERGEAQAELVSHYLGLLAASLQRLRDPAEAAGAVALLVPEVPHLRLAWRTAAMDGRREELDRAAPALFALCAARGCWAEAAASFGLALDWVCGGDGPDPCRDRLAQRLRALRGASLLHGGRVAEARDDLGAALAAAVRAGDLGEQVFCQGALAVAEARAGRVPEARRHAIEAVDAARNGPDTHVLAGALRDAAAARGEVGDLREAVTLLLELSGQEHDSLARQGSWETLVTVAETLMRAEGLAFAATLLARVAAESRAPTAVASRAERLLDEIQPRVDGPPPEVRIVTGDSPAGARPLHILRPTRRGPARRAGES